MSSVDIQTVSTPVILPQTDSVLPAPPKADSPPTVAGYIARVAFAGIVLAFAVAFVPIAAVYSFIWLAQI